MKQCYKENRNITKTEFFDNISKMEKPLVKRRQTQINRIRSERGDITTNSTEIQWIITDDYEQLYTNSTNQKKGIDSQKHNSF